MMADTLPAAEVATPDSLPGAEMYVYRSLEPEPVRLFVFKPVGWHATDRRPALIWFFGGGWNHGGPDHSVALARWASDLGLVGIAPDYRVKRRFGTPAITAVADGRAALHWVEEHASELGIDRARIVVGGNSAGGHLALWTAIAQSPPGSSPAEAPGIKPAALILTSAASDTTIPAALKYFGDDARSLSPIHQLDARMPPVIAFHGAADPLVPPANAVALHERLLATGNVSELHLVPNGSHNYGGDLPEWKRRTLDLSRDFLTRLKLLPAPTTPTR